MSFEWINITLGDFLNLKRGYDLPKTKRKDGDVPVISSSGYSGVHDISMVKGPGVVTGRYGTIGEVFYIPEKFWPLNTTLYVEDFKGNSPLFSYYLLQTIDFHAYSDKAAVPGINRNHVHMANIRVPDSIIAQEKIASILKKIEDKITFNKKINQTLEQMAQALFKSWFVDFDPVKVKIVAHESSGSQEETLLAAMTAISGKDTDALVVFEREYPEQYAELKATAELFPSAMQESELGEIPEGWKIESIGESYAIVMGQSPKGETYNEHGEGELFFQGRAEFGWRYPSPRLFTSDPKRIAEKGSVLLSVRAPVGDLNIALNSCCIGRGLASLLHKSQSASFSYYHLKSLGKIFKIFNGEGTVFGSINQKDLKAIKTLSATKEIVYRFDVLVGGFDNIILNNSKEIQSLTQLRDSLLPKLLSGEITLPEAEASINEATYV